MKNLRNERERNDEKSHQEKAQIKKNLKKIDITKSQNLKNEENILKKILNLVKMDG